MFIILAVFLFNLDHIMSFFMKVNLVINFDLPERYGQRSEPDYEVYLHRVGRAGRFGRKGTHC